MKKIYAFLCKAKRRVRCARNTEIKIVTKIIIIINTVTLAGGRPSPVGLRINIDDDRLIMMITVAAANKKGVGC